MGPRKSSNGDGALYSIARSGRKRISGFKPAKLYRNARSRCGSSIPIAKAYRTKSAEEPPGYMDTAVYIGEIYQYPLPRCYGRRRTSRPHYGQSACYGKYSGALGQRSGRADGIGIARNYGVNTPP